jgi:nucleotide-binding universal stress UspA family protein
MTQSGSERHAVITGIDGSAESAAALSWAGSYAAATGATVRAIRAWHFPTAAGVPPQGKAPELITEQIWEQMRGELAVAIAKAHLDPSVLIEMEIVCGHPAQVLIDESRTASLLVVGRGHGGFSEMLTGSVAIHCVNHAACPVVVVRGS